MSEDAGVRLYSPIDVLKPVAQDIWVVDGPEIGFGYGGLIPFPTRMTVIKLSNGELLLHSPIALTSELEDQLQALGPIQYLVSPNSLHYWWVPDRKQRFSNATVLSVAGTVKRAKRPLRVDGILTGRSPWPDDIDLLVVTGDVISEAVLFHRPSKTLILTDLIENFEPKKIRNWFYRRLLGIGGVVDPDGKAPIDLQLSFFRHRRALRAAVRQMIDWEPERVIIAHGRWYDNNGVAELRRAFRWVL